MARLAAVLIAVLGVSLGCEGSGKSEESAQENEKADDKADKAPVDKDKAPADKDKAPADSDKATPIDTKGSQMGGALADASVKEEEFDDLPVETPDDGKFVHGIRFADRNGTNWVVFSQKIKRTKAKGEFEDATESRYIYARHVSVSPDAGYKELRLVRDKVEDCPFDLTATFDKKSIAITDLDADGIGEVTFGYELACRSDVSPATYKLLLIEGGDKYIIRGTTKIMDPSGSYGGEMKIDPSLKKGPKEFLAHAKKLWPRLTRRR